MKVGLRGIAHCALDTRTIISVLGSFSHASRVHSNHEHHIQGARRLHIMESISRLRTILLTSLGSRGAHHGEQELFDELLVHQECLLNLFDVGSRNAQEQREIESGALYC